MKNFSFYALLLISIMSGTIHAEGWFFWILHSPVQVYRQLHTALFITPSRQAAARALKEIVAKEQFERLSALKEQQRERKTMMQEDFFAYHSSQLHTRLDNSALKAEEERLKKENALLTLSLKDSEALEAALSNDNKSLTSELTKSKAKASRQNYNQLEKDFRIVKQNEARYRVELFNLREKQNKVKKEFALLKATIGLSKPTTIPLVEAATPTLQPTKLRTIPVVIKNNTGRGIEGVLKKTGWEQSDKFNLNDQYDNSCNPLIISADAKQNSKLESDLKHMHGLVKDVVYDLKFTTTDELYIPLSTQDIINYANTYNDAFERGITITISPVAHGTRSTPLISYKASFSTGTKESN